jgi:hypothetical protein
MAQTSKISSNNTTIERDDQGRIVRVTLYQTVVVTILYLACGKREVSINNGGYNTVTTQTRVNQVFNELGIRARYLRAGGIGRVEFGGCSVARVPCKLHVTPEGEIVAAFS